MPKASDQQWAQYLMANPARIAIEAGTRSLAKEVATKAKEELISKVLNDPVSEEIASGPDATNTSDTLNGYGNLFSFLGFRDSDTPISDLINYLETVINLSSKKPLNKERGNGLVDFYYIFNFVDEDSFNNTKFSTPWGVNWIYGIRNGVPNFSHYLRTNKSKASRSGGGVQIKAKIDRGIRSNKPREYIFKYIRSIRKRIQRNEA